MALRHDRNRGDYCRCAQHCLNPTVPERRAAKQKKIAFMRHGYTTRDGKTAKTRHQLSHLFLSFLPIGCLSFEHGRHGGSFVGIVYGGCDNRRRCFLQEVERLSRQRDGNRTRTTNGLDIEDGSSFVLNRFDIAPLCHVAPLAIEDTEVLDVFVELSGTPAIYIAALPFPGLADGRRLTMTEEERGMI